MKTTAITTPIFRPHDDFFAVMRASVLRIPERSVLAVTSKVLGLCEGRFVPDSADKDAFIRQEAEYWLPREASALGFCLTVSQGQLNVNAGIDHSNTNGLYVAWPADLQSWANKIWRFVRAEYGCEQVGVIITDSKTTPMKWGVTGTCLAHCGFAEIADQRGVPDLFGQKLQVTTIGVAQALAAAAVFEMGEAAERTPFCILEDIRTIEFQNHEPTPAELAAVRIELDTDVYAPLLTAVPWKKGGRAR